MIAPRQASTYPFEFVLLSLLLMLAVIPSASLMLPEQGWHWLPVALKVSTR